MKTINTLAEIIAAAQNEKIYVRWSRGPDMDEKQKHSHDQVSGNNHNGLSCQNIRVDDPQLLARMLQEYSFLRRKDSKIYCWIFAATRNGTDSDGAPTVDAETIRPIGRISEKLISKCDRFADTYHAMATKYAHNAWKPEHFERNAKIEAELNQAWSEIQ